MQIFHELIMNEYLSGTRAVSSLHWAATMGNIDVFRFFIVADQVVGAGTTLIIFAGESPTMTKEIPGGGTQHLLGPVTLVSAQANVFTASIAGADALTGASYSLAINVNVGGTARVRIWATGRGRA